MTFRMSYRRAGLLLLGTFILLFASVLFRGEVIFPHDNSLEVGVPRNAGDPYLSNRKFSDESAAFIPELANNLSADHQGWINTWNPHVELGRPALQISGLSQAYLLVNALSFLTVDPFVLYTALVLLVVGLTGLFGLLFFRALELHPIAAAAGALGLCFSTAVMYWLTFVMFLSTICWSTCLLWLITEYLRKASWPVALGISFAVYSLLLTGYPQMTVLFAYIIAAYTLLRLVQFPGSLKAKLARAMGLLGSASIGALASLPVYLDLFAVARNSARLSGVGSEFFLAVLPPHQGIRPIAAFITSIFDWSWLGNAISPDYSEPFNGLSFTPAFGCLIWLSLLVRAKHAVFWQAVFLLCLAGTIFPSIYLFAVHYLGFGFSRIQLFCGAIIPGFVLSACTIDAVLRGKFRLRGYSVAWLLLPLVFEITVASVIWQPKVIASFAVILTVLFVVALALALYYQSAPGVIGITLLSVFAYGRPLILSRPESSIFRASALTETLKQQSDGSRFAIGDPAIKRELPPNQEALLKIRSINSYDSLSPRSYQELISRWSLQKPWTYGRYFKFISPELALADPEFRLADVGIILSKRPIRSHLLTDVAEVEGTRFYSLGAAPIGLLQTASYNTTGDAAVQLDSLSSEGKLSPSRTKWRDDFQVIKLNPVEKKTLLFVSQQYHSAWQASAHDRPLRTVRVNGFYEGILVPPNTSEIVLFFRPYVLWSWLPQLLFVGCGVFFFSRSVSRSRTAGLTGGGLTPSHPEGSVLGIGKSQSENSGKSLRNVV